MEGFGLWLKSRRCRDSLFWLGTEVEDADGHGKGYQIGGKHRHVCIWFVIKDRA